ncbi:MAG: hypothetical protein S4CHLAM45_01970 [Chlamydiales bacterium]|nr:hypothetical protein [Chlamydiales bacterium]MCH9620334.1 hypothetical protein [Chlamydiales bacterium]MCH9622320.1 hypothetical protein [Chlamydiales bacterium]
MNTSPLFGDLNLYSSPGTNSRTMICCHGYGGNYQIADKLRELGIINSTLISFNFPDHDLEERVYNPQDLTFGTINELLPALHVLKKTVIDKGYKSIDLYGNSAGGGAVINLIALLNSNTYSSELEESGITVEVKQALLNAVQNGIVVLDVPLKSVEEIIHFRGSNPELEALAKNYQNSNMRPIDSICSLKELSLNILLYFEEMDELIYNRDDKLFIQRLKKSNSLGKTTVIIGNEGGHTAPHWPLWKAYSLKSQDLK